MKTLKETTEMEETPSCIEDYENLNIESKIAKNLGSSLIKKGVKVDKGKYIDIHENQLSSNITILDIHGDSWGGPKKIAIRQSLSLSDHEEGKQEDGDEDGDDLKRKHRNSSSTTGPLLPLGWFLLFYTLNTIF